MDRTGHDELLDLEADAVCEQCSTVNPPGTLLCKVCGNNLRDQRTRRMSGEGVVEVAPATDRPRNLVLGTLAIVGLIIILVAALKVNSIEAMMTRGFSGTDDGSASAQYWNGTNHEIYDDLLATLTAKPVTEQEILLASAQPPLTVGFDGRYVIKRGIDVRAPAIGQGIAKMQGDTLYFVGKIGRNTEIRGSAQLTTQSTLTAENAGTRTGDDYNDCYGIGEVRDIGRIQCSGYIGGSDSPVTALILRIPEAPPGTPESSEPESQ